MAEEKLLTRHPLGKSGKNIDKQKYDAVKAAILSALAKKELTHTDLFDRLNKALKGKFDGSINWYGETVKLDLEARKIIQRTSEKPSKYRLKQTITPVTATEVNVIRLKPRMDTKGHENKI